MREPVGRGLMPRQDGRCVHHWRLGERGRVRCRFCGGEQARCPHDWRWEPIGRRWRCAVCATERADR